MIESGCLGMRDHRGRRETRLEERLEPGKVKFSRSRVWSTMSDSAERSEGED